MSDIEVTMPDLSTADAEVKVVQWLVAPGQPVTRGQLLLEVETDKAVNEVESFATGTLKEVLVAAGDLVEAGQTIAIIESVGSSEAAAPAEAAAGPPAAMTQTPPAPVASQVGSGKGLFARNRQQSAQPATNAATAGSLPLSAAQRAVARRMLQSKQNAPHFYLQASANAEGMIACREAAKPEKLAWDAFFVHAAGKALAQFDRMCARYKDDQLLPQPADVVGVAVDIDGDLYVIPVADPANRSPIEISAEIRQQVQALRDGDQSAARLRPASMTVTNLGVANVESFTAILNPPESSILAVGKIGPAVTPVNGQPIVQNRVTVTLSVDHRVVSGRYAAQFLEKIVQELESF